MELRRNKLYTIEDWMSWDEDIRAEIIDGGLYMLAQPTEKHQRILTELVRQLANFLKGKPCNVYPAPFGVRLSKNENTGLEPDIVVICDKSKLENGRVYNGAPEMVVEILSPSTARTDRLIKYHKYMKAGVQEYWIIDPDLNIAEVNILQNGVYAGTRYGDEGEAPVDVLSLGNEKCIINLTDLFAE